jgi:fluoride exporter
MSFLEVVGIGLLGGVGAVARFLLDGGIAGRLGRTFPYGTMVVNLSGSFLLGALIGAALPARTSEVLTAGLVGAFTTFSTWVFESHRLGEDHQGRLAAMNLMASLVLGVAVAWLGRQVGLAL